MKIYKEDGALKISNLPANHEIWLAGEVNSDLYFLFLHAIDEVPPFGISLIMGSENNLEPVEIFSVDTLDEQHLRRIKTQKGDFFIPLSTSSTPETATFTEIGHNQRQKITCFKAVKDIVLNP